MRGKNSVLFNSFEFIFLFLPIVWVVYFIFNKQHLYIPAKIWLVISSLFFYSWWNIFYLPLIIFSLMVNYSLGLTFKKISTKKSKLLILSIGIGFNVLLLGYYKYYDFFITTVNSLSDTSFPILNIALPLAISFFTFQQVAYLVDAYQDEVRDLHIVDYMLFVLFFPQLIAGPIVQHHEITPQFQNNNNYRINYKNIALGTFVFIIGIFKKVVIADSLAIWANQGFQNPSSLSLVESWVATLSYTFQLYFDFSGYSDMAIGLGLLFNIKIPVNFLSPYRSLDIQEFWRRWHITLGRFFTQYIYIPLGGNRNGNKRTYLNLFFIFFLSGIWHGAGWTFIIWGSLHGLATLIHRMWKKSKYSLPKPASWLLTFLFIHFAWVFFRADTTENAITIIKSMLGLSDSNWLFRFQSEGNTLLEMGHLLNFEQHENFISLIVVLSTLFFTIWFVPNSIDLKERFKPTLSYSFMLLVMIAIVVFINFSSNINSEFLYFNF